MPGLRIPLNQRQAYSSSGGQLQFDLARLASQSIIDGKHLHIRDLVIVTRARVVQADGAVAVKGIDQPALLTGITLQRDASDPATIMLDNVPGDCVQLLDYMRSSGVHPHPIPADVAANSSGGPLTTAIEFKTVVRLDDPLTGSPDDGCIPFAAVANGKLSVTVGNIASVWSDNKLSLDSTGNDVDVYIWATVKDEPTMGRDARVKIVNDSSNATKTGIRLDAGRYEALIYYPQKLGNQGGENCSTAVTAISGANGGQGLVFPADLTGAEYNAEFFRRGAYLAMQDTNSPVGNQKCVVLVAAGPFSSIHGDVFEARADFLLDVTLSGTLNKNHRFIAVRVFAPRAAEDARVAARSGYQSFTARPKTADGRPLAVPARAAYVPRTITSATPTRK